MQNQRDVDPGLLQETPRAGPPGRWKTILLTTAFLLGLLLVLWAIFGDRLTPAVPVRTARVLLLPQQEQDSATSVAGTSELMFQASGWIEPDPWPVNMAALTQGFVEDVLVKEGEAVTNGQLLATLDSKDARLELDTATLEIRRLQARSVAASNAVASARAALSVTRAEAKAAAARLAEARDNWKRIEALRDSDTSALERNSAERSYNEQQALQDAAEANIKRGSAFLEERIAAHRTALAATAVARKGRDIAQLALDRTAIRSNMDGIILQRFVEPGSKRSAAQDDPHSAVIASLYDPGALQVRVDVPIAEAGKLRAGQPARISTAMLPNTHFDGRVTRIVGLADLQRNTLQAKVAIAKPDPRMRPDVLCRVEFWSMAGAGPEPHGAATGSAHHSLWIPEGALADSTQARQDVWVVDPLMLTAQQRAIMLGPESRPGYRRVASGLRANEAVVIGTARDLKNGCRVRITAKEQSP